MMNPFQKPTVSMYNASCLLCINSDQVTVDTFYLYYKNDLEQFDIIHCRFSDMEGNLLKWIGYLSGWQMKYFVLSSGELSLYESKVVHYYFLLISIFPNTTELFSNPYNVVAGGCGQWLPAHRIVSHFPLRNNCE